MDNDSTEHVDRLITALIAIEAAAADNIERSVEIQSRAAKLIEDLQAGSSLVSLVEQEPEPRVVEMLSANMAVLEGAGAQLRAAQAMALRAEGLTIEAIAGLFGVTRQRISALLKQKAATQQ